MRERQEQMRLGLSEEAKAVIQAKNTARHKVVSNHLYFLGSTSGPYVIVRPSVSP